MKNPFTTGTRKLLPVFLGIVLSLLTVVAIASPALAVTGYDTTVVSVGSSSGTTITYGESVSFNAHFEYYNSGWHNFPSGKSIDFRLDSSGGALLGSALTNSSGVATLPTASYSSLTHVGSDWRIYAVWAGDASYQSTYDHFHLWVNELEILVTPDSGQSKAAGSADPVLTYHVSTPPVFSDTFTGHLTRQSGESVGNYHIYQGTLALNGNYDLDFTGNVHFAITSQPLIITPNPGQSKVYGSSDPVFTYTISTGAPPATPDFNPANSYSISGALGRATGENVSTYAYTLGNLAITGYSLSLGGTNTFAITPLSVTVTPNAGQSKIYGDIDPVLTYTVSPPTPPFTPTFNPALSISYPFTGALSRAAGADIGQYAITQGTLALNSNYTLVFTSGVKFTINAKPITVTANAQIKFMTTADPVLTYAVVPALISGDSFTGSLTRAPGEIPGYYNISLGTLSAGANYSIAFVANRLEIRSVFTEVGPTTVAPNATTVPAVPTTTTTPPTTTTTPPTTTTTPPTTTTTPPTTTTTPPTTTTTPPTTTTTTPPTTTTTPPTTTTTPPTTTTASGSGTGTGVIVGAGGGVLVVLLGGLLFLFWRRRKKDDKDKK